MSTVMQAALRLAEEHGIPVFPCRPDKKPYTANGFKDASANLTQVTDWFDRYPDALIGVPTGNASHLLAIDIDPEGDPWYQAHFQRLACGCVHSTPRGHHLLYRMPKEDIRCSASVIAKGVDVRAEGGYIIWWPAHGFKSVGDLDDVTEAPAINWKGRPKVNGNGLSPVAVQGIGEGGRNAALTSLAGKMRRAGATHSELLAALSVFNARCTPQLPDHEIATIAQSMLRYTPVSDAPALKAPRQEEPVTPAVRRPMNWTALEGRIPPERAWAIGHWLGSGTTLLAGRGGVGKTLLAQTIATALALGRNFLDTVAAPQRVLFWACEDELDELWRRQVAICRHFGVNLADLEGKLIIEPRSGLDNTLFYAEYGAPKWTPLHAELMAQVGDYRSEVTIIDNIGQTFGGKENDRHHVTAFVNGMTGLAPGRTHSTVLLAHPGKQEDSEFSGSTAWENSVRMRWYMGMTLPDQAPEDVTGESDPDVRYVSKRKQNYTVKDYRKLVYRDGVFAVEQQTVGALAQRYSGAERITGAEQAVLEALDQFLAAGVRTIDSRTSPDYLPKRMRGMKLAQDFSPRELGDALNRLRLSGRIVEGPLGKFANRTVKYGLVRGQS